LEIVPSFAWQIFEQLSLGVGVRAVRVAQELKTQAVAVPVGAGTVVDTLDDLNVKGWGVGAQFGLLYRPKEWISFGANYRSKVTVNLEGDATFATFGATDASFDQVLPTLFTIGTSVKPIDNLTVGLQYDFERNSEIEPLVVNLTTLNVSAPFGVKWDDSHTIHLGADYQLLENAAVRVGYAKDLNESVPDTQNNRVLGDVAAHEVSVGGAYTWRRYTFGLAWNARFGDRQWPNNGTNVAPGKLDAIVQSISFGVSTSL
jgi:long-chain fatty acid transport protein